MGLDVNWTNPYADRRGQWYKGNLHAHTTPASRCGRVEVARVLELYRQAGYDFLAVSDHLALTLPEAAGLVLIPGVEWNSPKGEHAGLYSLDHELLRWATAIDDQRALLERAGQEGGQAFVVLNHPNWQLRPHYRREELADRQGFDAIEIYNGVIERLAGYAIATDKWDYLLANGRRVLGVASDDSHSEEDIGQAAIVVRAPDAKPATLLGALRQGNFYCTSGVTLTDIDRQGDVVTVQADDAQEIQAIGEGGTRIARVRASAMSFSLADTQGAYLRFAAYGPGSAMAWTQPFFRD